MIVSLDYIPELELFDLSSVSWRKLFFTVNFFYHFIIFTFFLSSFIFHCMESQVRGPCCARRFVQRFEQKKLEHPQGVALPIV